MVGILKKPRDDRGLAAALQACGRGGVSELARRLRALNGETITFQAVSAWTRVPRRWVESVERATGVPRERLRPDLY